MGGIQKAAGMLRTWVAEAWPLGKASVLCEIDAKPMAEPNIRRSVSAPLGTLMIQVKVTNHSTTTAADLAIGVQRHLGWHVISVETMPAPTVIPGAIRTHNGDGELCDERVRLVVRPGETGSFMATYDTNGVAGGAYMGGGGWASLAVRSATVRVKTTFDSVTKWVEPTIIE